LQGRVISVQPGHVLYIRSTPVADSSLRNKVGELKLGDAVPNIIGEQGDWYIVQLPNNQQGYVAKKFVSGVRAASPAGGQPVGARPTVTPASSTAAALANDPVLGVR
jgi:hypothetical protein